MILKFDLNLTITGIVALSAIISPIIVALINNRHQRRMHKLDTENKLKQDALSSFILSAMNYYGEHSFHDSANYYHDLNNLYAYFDIDDSLLDEITNSSNCNNIKTYNDNIRKFIKTLAMQIQTTKQPLIKRIFHKLKHIPKKK